MIQRLTCESLFTQSDVREIRLTITDICTRIKSLHSSESSFITVSDDQKIKIWRMEWKDDGSSPFPVLQQTLHYHTSYVLSCDVNHDGK